MIDIVIVQIKKCVVHHASIAIETFLLLISGTLIYTKVLFNSSSNTKHEHDDTNGENKMWNINGIYFSNRKGVKWMKHTIWKVCTSNCYRLCPTRQKKTVTSFKALRFKWQLKFSKGLLFHVICIHWLQRLKWWFDEKSMLNIASKII